MRRLALGIVFFLLCGKLALAALTFPALTGRVVDDAHMLSAHTVESLDRMLGDYERGTSNQAVVVTLPSLQGDAIEDYGYQLGRAWQIGQKGKNNGVLLIVAPNERKVRIEVGYGLEGTLTDAASNAIIQTIILPDFRAGHMEQGVVDGTKAMLAVLGGQSVAAPAQTENGQQLSGWMFLILIVVFIYFCINHPVAAAFLLSNSMSRYGGGSSGGGGFSGGGGSFGGGGASGGW
jgi:uncharacterized protein